LCQRYWHSLIDKGRYLCRVKLTQAAKGQDTGKCIDANDTELCMVYFRVGKPVQHLKNLQLIQQVVFKPERYPIIVRRRCEMVVSQAEVAKNLVVGQCRPGEIIGSDL
jgi:hypothetical protein